MMEHTKEPWASNVVVADGNGWCNPTQVITITADDGATVIAHYSTEACEYPSDEQNEANARRIVACVNACKGIPTRLLETRTDMGAAEVSRLMELESQLAAALEQADAENAELRAQVEKIAADLAMDRLSKSAAADQLRALSTLTTGNAVKMIEARVLLEAADVCDAVYRNSAPLNVGAMYGASRCSEALRKLAEQRDISIQTPENERMKGKAGEQREPK